MSYTHTFMVYSQRANTTGISKINTNINTLKVHVIRKKKVIKMMFPCLYYTIFFISDITYLKKVVHTILNYIKIAGVIKKPFW